MKFAADTMNLTSLESAFKNIDVIFYLVHSMSDTKDFMKAEEISAKKRDKSSNQNNVKRTIYLVDFSKKKELSKHLEKQKKSWTNSSKFIN